MMCCMYVSHTQSVVSVTLQLASVNFFIPTYSSDFEVILKLYLINIWFLLSTCLDLYFVTTHRGGFFFLKLLFNYIHYQIAELSYKYKDYRLTLITDVN